MDKIFTPIKGRIMLYIDYKHINKLNFYAETGISASNFKGNGSKSELGGDKIAKILTLYNDLNPNWLLTGQGSMLKTNASTVNFQSIKGDSNNIMKGDGTISVNDYDAKQSSHIISELNERLKKQELYIQSLLEEQKSLHQQISKLIDKLK